MFPLKKQVSPGLSLLLASGQGNDSNRDHLHGRRNLGRKVQGNLLSSQVKEETVFIKTKKTFFLLKVTQLVGSLVIVEWSLYSEKRQKKLLIENKFLKRYNQFLIDLSEEK